MRAERPPSSAEVDRENDGRVRRHWTIPLGDERKWSIGGGRAQVLGVLNVTPDSFSDGGALSDVAAAVDRALGMVDEGADVIDIGGESTRPGAEPVSAAEQLRRVLPVIESLRPQTSVPLSIDTASPEVGREALAAGADVINEVTGCRDPGWEPVLAETKAPVILMHMQGTPRIMQDRPHYPEGVIDTVREFFVSRAAALGNWGVSADRLIFDPGIGFGKQLEHNLDLIRSVGRLRVLDRPLLVGASRKRMIGDLLGRPVGARDVGSVAVHAAAVLSGADIIRAHNVEYTRDLVVILAAIEGRAA